MGLPASELNAISLEAFQSLDQALTRMLLLWLRQRYDVARFGHPTWKRLEQAIEKINPILAKTIASNHAIITGLWYNNNIIAHNTVIVGITFSREKKTESVKARFHERTV